MALENIANSDAAYHDVFHTILVTEVGQQILKGKHILQGGVTPGDWMHFTVASLLHDIGYVRGVCPGDHDGTYATGVEDRTVSLGRGATDAALTAYRAAQRAKASRFVFMSTCSVYGKQPGDFIATEDSALNPQSLYAETKLQAEQALLEEARGSSTSVTILRLSTLFGLAPRMRFDLVVNKFTLLGQTTGRLTVFGPESWRPYLHVADAAGAIAAVLSAPREQIAQQVFNVGSENHQTKDIAEFVRGYYEGIDVDTVAGGPDPRDYRVSFEHLRAATGFEPSRTVLGGIHEMAMALGSGLLHRGPYVNNGFTDMDFDVRNPRYGFR